MKPTVTMIFSIEIMSTSKEIKYHLKQSYRKQKSYPPPYPTTLPSILPYPTLSYPTLPYPYLLHIPWKELTLKTLKALNTLE